MIHKRYDFRGGYVTDLAPEQTDPNFVLEGQNLYYKGKLKSRPGWSNYSADTTINTTNYVVRGFCRAFINSAWCNVIALDDTTDVNFYYGTTGSYTAIDAGYGFTKNINVEMVFFNDCVVAVNGTDKPAIIYYSGSWIVKNLEAYDARSRGDDEWYAGYYDVSATPTFIDDTTDAQSTTADDFQLMTGAETDDDGFYVAGVSVFNKIVLKTCDQFDGSPVATYKYYAGNNVWTALTTTTVPTWTAAAGDKTIEFDLPLNADGTLAWQKYGDLSDQVDPTGVPGGILNRYVVLVQFTTAPTSTMYCNYLEISHTQYLTQIFLNDKPEAVCVHQNRLFLAAGNAFRFSPPNQVTEWDSRDIEYCSKGGETIKQLVSCDDYLAIIKAEAIYRYLGTTTLNFVLRHTPCAGGVSKRGAAYCGNVLIYAAQDGVRAFLDGKSIILSRHIQTDMDTWTKTDAAAISWDGDLVMSFPTNSIMLWADPDTIRQDDMGDGRLSFWEWTGLKTPLLLYAADAGLVVAFDSTNRRLVKNTTNGYDVAFDTTTQTAITQTLQTKYESFGDAATKKCVKRQKIELKKSGDWTVTIYANDAQVSATKTVSSGTGTGHYIADVSIPYTLDGYNLSTKLVNATTNAVEIYGITTEVEGRAF